MVHKWFALPDMGSGDRPVAIWRKNGSNRTMQSEVVPGGPLEPPGGKGALPRAPSRMYAVQPETKCFLHAAAGAFGEKTDQIASSGRKLAHDPLWGKGRGKGGNPPSSPNGPQMVCTARYGFRGPSCGHLAKKRFKSHHAVGSCPRGPTGAPRGERGHSPGPPVRCTRFSPKQNVFACRCRCVW